MFHWLIACASTLVRLHEEIFSVIPSGFKEKGGLMVVCLPKKIDLATGLGKL